MPFSPVVTVASPADQPLLFHVQDRAERSRLHGADPVGKLALGQAVLVPESAEEIPHPERDAVRLDLVLEEPLKGAVGSADLIADAFAKRKIDLARR